MLKGFQSETEDSQKIFRKLLTAMAHPGTIFDTELEMTCPGTLHPATGLILLTLLDFDTPFWSDLESAAKEIRWISFHSGAPVTRLKKSAAFALVTDAGPLDDYSDFNPGSLESPDQSTTLLIQVSELSESGQIRLSGPGIQKEAYLKLPGVRPDFLSRRSGMEAIYPLGIDMIFICGSRFVALPRTTRLEVF